MSKADKSPTPLSVMLGDGDFFTINKGKSYTVEPIALMHIEEFMKDDISIGAQLFNMTNKKAQEKVDKWLSGIKDNEGNIVRPGYCFDEEGNPVSLEKAMEDGWNLVDLRNFFKKLCDLSG